MQGVEEPLHYKEIAERIGVQGLKKTLGVTPDATVGAQLYKGAQDKSSPFEGLGKGKFRLKVGTLASSSEDIVASEPDSNLVSEEDGAIRAFGMYWRRDWVVWSSKPNLIGRQQANASPLNFAEQVGVYLLHDRDRTIYVGRASDSIADRLRAHTQNRLSGRWDRFSWFGLYAVSTNDGQLVKVPQSWSHDAVITTLEAILIESLEPPLNRKQGDGFTGTEYLQVEDPQIEEKSKKAVVAEMLKKAGLSL